MFSVCEPIAKLCGWLFLCFCLLLYKAKDICVSVPMKFSVLCFWVSYHMACMYVGGRRGLLTGVQLYDLIILSASRKLRNKLATSRSWRNNFWNKSKDRGADWKLSIVEWETEEGPAWIKLTQVRKMGPLNEWMKKEVSREQSGHFRSKQCLCVCLQNIEDMSQSHFQLINVFTNLS